MQYHFKFVKLQFLVPKSAILLLIFNKCYFWVVGGIRTRHHRLHKPILYRWATNTVWIAGLGPAETFFRNQYYSLRVYQFRHIPILGRLQSHDFTSLLLYHEKTILQIYDEFLNNANFFLKKCKGRSEKRPRILFYTWQIGYNFSNVFPFSVITK